MSEPTPVSDFAAKCMAILAQLTASSDSNERAMLHERLKRLLMTGKDDEA